MTRRIFFMATYPDQPIGYSRVAHILSNWLAEQPDVELYYFGTGNYPHARVSDRTIDPRIHFIDILAEERKIGSNEEYGMDIIDAWMRKLNPDVFLIYNDIIVTCRAFNALIPYRAEFPTCRFVSYLDLVYPYEKLEFLQHVDRNTDQVYVFSECWKTNLEAVGFAPEKVHVFPHGFSTSLFPMESAAAKAYFGLSADDFVILNTNRNTYRKALDVGLRAFVDFLVREQFDPRIKLFLNCALKTDNGYTIRDLLEVEAVRNGVDVGRIQAHIRTLPEHAIGHASDLEINLMYNACDVGINTCMGEGFGLCNMEHAGLGKPQIVSKVGALADIFAEGGAILVEPRAWIRVPNMLDEHSGDLGVCDWSDFSAAMSTYFHDSAKRTADGAWGAATIPVRFAWSTILRTFNQTFSPPSV